MSTDEDNHVFHVVPSSDEHQDMKTKLTGLPRGVALNLLLFLAGFSTEGGTRRLVAAYFGIYSRLLCV